MLICRPYLVNWSSKGAAIKVMLDHKISLGQMIKDSWQLFQPQNNSSKCYQAIR